MRNLLVYSVTQYTGRFLKNINLFFKMNFYRDDAGYFHGKQSDR
jgi:hypothetical protein